MYILYSKIANRFTKKTEKRPAALVFAQNTAKLIQITNE